jgi:hypothetical protein
MWKMLSSSSDDAARISEIGKSTFHEGEKSEDESLSFVISMSMDSGGEISDIYDAVLEGAIGDPFEESTVVPVNNMETTWVRRYDDVEIIEGVARGQRVEIRVGGDDGGRSAFIEDGGVRVWLNGGDYNEVRYFLSPGLNLNIGVDASGIGQCGVDRKIVDCETTRGMVAVEGVEAAKSFGASQFEKRRWCEE